MITYYNGAISTRNLFGQMLNDMGLTHYGVEIGTHRGDFAFVLLHHWKGYLSCIDPWSIPEGYEAQNDMLWNSTSREDDKQFTIDRLSKYPLDRYGIIQSTSRESLKLFKDNSLDFVYIDGDHRYEEVKHDLTEWYKKTKLGGIIAGHDVIMPGEINGGWGPGIQQAIEESIPHSNPVYLVVEENGLPWSFYVIKRSTT